MYAGIWRILPGPVWLRVIFIIVLVAAILYALGTVVFPWIDVLLIPNPDLTNNP